MPAVEPARERIARRLQDAVDRLRRDMDEVEFWTEVLGCLTRPAPDYESSNVLNRFALPPQGSDRSEQGRAAGLGRSAERTGNGRHPEPSQRRHSSH